MPIERIAGGVESDIVRQFYRQIRLGHGNDAAGLAVNDRDRAAPVALARNAPVAQLEIDLPLRLRAIAQCRSLKTPRDLFLGRGDRHSVEEPRIDHRSLAVVGDVINFERHGIDPGRADDRRRAQPVDIDEVEVALVVRGTAEDRARAVIHQNEVRDIDRQPPIRIEGMDDPNAGVEALLFRRLDRGDRGADPPALFDEFGKLRIYDARRRRPTDDLARPP